MVANQPQTRRWATALAKFRTGAGPCIPPAVIGAGRKHSNVVFDEPATRKPATRRVRPGVILGVVTLSVLVGLTGWLGLRAYQAVQEQRLHTQLLEAGRDGAVTLTTINHTEVEADVKRILAASAGPFFDDFQNRSQSFVTTVKNAQSTTKGTVVAAGLESVHGDQADVLVTVSVKTSLAGSEAPPRLWRMRIGVQQVGRVAKVSDVEFVP